MKWKMLIQLSLVCVVLFFLSVLANGGIISEGSKTFLVDRNNEKWDISQAVKNGYDPKKFQYGIGRNAFIPLDDRSLSSNQDKAHAASRVIGVKDKEGGKAFSVDRLRNHEIANSYQNSDPVAVAY